MGDDLIDKDEYFPAFAPTDGRRSLARVLAELASLDEEFPEIDDQLTTPEDIL